MSQTTERPRRIREVQLVVGHADVRVASGAQEMAEPRPVVDGRTDHGLRGAGALPCVSESRATSARPAVAASDTTAPNPFSVAGSGSGACWWEHRPASECSGSDPTPLRGLDEVDVRAQPVPRHADGQEI